MKTSRNLPLAIADVLFVAASRVPAQESKRAPKDKLKPADARPVTPAKAELTQAIYASTWFGGDPAGRLSGILVNERSEL